MPVRKIKKILLPYVNHVRKLRIRSTIRDFDQGVNTSSWIGASFYEGYFTPFEISPPSTYSPQGVARSNKINSKIAEVAKDIIDDFSGFIVGYLGDRARLDDMYLFWFDPEKIKDWSLSNSWHDDNVGSRVKIYVCFSGNGNTPTVVLPNSHNKPYSPRWGEISRFSGVRNVESLENQIALRYKSGDVAVFDTSCLHRGLYEQPAAKRTVLVLEFINRDKSNVIAGFSPCGPGMSRTGEVVFDAKAFEFVRQTGMLDEELLSEKNGEYIYSLKNLNKKI
ncbi:phytanoyl-CoA dioxygenase family protein [Pseudomonas tussilaginis]|uniref:hypothetical protein n=1 Tax=Pseudomonas putida TaxID=303 RepID=UPI00236388D5|nr:hypothetical protein [Pseudomonas putida]MDD1976835.1 hypothetical protein [Pseudomonas putida]